MIDITAERNRLKAEAHKQYRRDDTKTITGKLVMTHAGMRARVKGPLKTYHGLPLCTKQQFTRWSLRSKAYVNLWETWKASGYNRSLSPSIDRIDNAKGYTLDNMQWLTMSDHTKKTVREREAQKHL